MCSYAFFALTAWCSNEINILLSAKKLFPGLIRMLGHPDIQISLTILKSINNIVYSGTETTQMAEQHPLYDEIQSCDGIESIFTLFQQNRDPSTKDRAAICIGRLFRTREITDPIMRNEIINHLKSLVNDLADWIKVESRKALINLSQNTVNMAEIERDGFIFPE
ncbi:MAG: hypothetical protein EZS28_034063 [Streblomastix strix]|uniref:Uncharacterized protein n=1 Tax=Streblomastix strix TaxID=222440 RepID=A0A5J4UJZ5_9EUKA|nr:MAG: hypothetical protein EZS28_034063 [Streblomastix strix]